MGAEIRDQLPPIPMSPTLGQTLTRAATYAQEQGHAEVALEHLLLALAEDDDARQVLDSSGVEISALHTDISQHVGRIEDRLPPGSQGTARISEELRRILNAAAVAARAGRRPSIDGAIVLAAVIGDGRTSAAGLLRAHGLTFEVAINAIRQVSRPAVDSPPPPAPLPPPGGAADLPPPPPVKRPASSASDILAQARARVASRHAPGYSETRAISAAEGSGAGSDDRLLETDEIEMAADDGSWPEAGEPADGDAGQVPDSAAVYATGNDTDERAEFADDHGAEADFEAEPDEASGGLAPTEADPRDDVPAAGDDEPQPADALSHALDDAADEMSENFGVEAGEPGEAVDHPPDPSPQPPPQPQPPPFAPSPPAPVTEAQPAPSRIGANLPPRPAVETLHPAPPQRYEGPPPPVAGNQPLRPGQGWAPPPATPRPPPAQPRPRGAPPPIPPEMPSRPPAPAPPGPPRWQPAHDAGEPQAPPGAAGTSRQPPWAPPLGGHPPPYPQQPPSPAPIPAPVPAPVHSTAPAPPPAGYHPHHAQQPGAPEPARQHYERMPMPAREAESAAGPTSLPRPSTVLPGQLIETVPRRMRVGVTAPVEVRIAKAEVKAISDGLDVGRTAHRHDIQVTKAMSVRLRAPEGGFFIETASPETQWIENALGLMADDYARWRWTVTPKLRGKRRLLLIVSARTVGPDGLAAETALPDQIIEIRVSTNYGVLVKRLAGWVVAAIAGGLLARFGSDLWTLMQPVLQSFPPLPL